jgi:hypothetical protein
MQSIVSLSLTNVAANFFLTLALITLFQDRFLEI